MIGAPGDEKEALINEEGAIEVDKLAFSIEPFISVRGLLLTWNESTNTQSLLDNALPIPTVHRSMPGLDLGRELSVAMCVPDAMPRCHWIDPAEELVGKISGDGIHPTHEGYDILGQMTWDLMQERKLRR